MTCMINKHAGGTSSCNCFGNRWRLYGMLADLKCESITRDVSKREQAHFPRDLRASQLRLLGGAMSNQLRRQTTLLNSEPARDYPISNQIPKHGFSKISIGTGSIRRRRQQAGRFSRTLSIIFDSLPCYNAELQSTENASRKCSTKAATRVESRS